MYIKIKRGLDFILAGIGMLGLSPVFLLLALLIKLDSKGPVFFKQKRVGIHKSHFYILKFRTMRTDTPKDMPTHLLKNPEQYITKMGKFLRKTSLDELPQIINILKGDMSIIGPRPALWNQYDLIAERDKYGANDILPGLTGWAQINGRDELEIDVKAKLDGEYVKKMSFLFDMKCFVGTIFSVLKSDGIVEGGTGKKKKQNISKKVLIVANVAKEHVLKFHVPTIKMLKENGWHVDVACAGEEGVPFCDNQFRMSYRRNPFTFKTIIGIVELRKILKEGKYDVVHCHTPTGGVVARLSTLGLRQRPYVMYTAHGFHFFKGASLVNWLVFFPVEWLLSFLTDRLIVINKEDYQTAKKYKMQMKDIRLLHGMGVDEEKFTTPVSKEIGILLKQELNIPKDEIVFTYVAEILKNKNQEVLIKAIKKVREKTGKGILVLVGPVHDEGAYQQFAKAIGIEKYVRFTGWRSDVKNFYAITDVYVASSLREGLGLNLVEAQFAGLPVIASKNRGHKESIDNGKNGFLVNPLDEEMFAEKMITLLQDEDLRKEFSERGKMSAEKFSLESSVKRIKSFYKSIENN